MEKKVVFSISPKTQITLWLRKFMGTKEGVAILDLPCSPEAVNGPPPPGEPRVEFPFCAPPGPRGVAPGGGGGGFVGLGGGRWVRPPKSTFAAPLGGGGGGWQRKDRDTGVVDAPSTLPVQMYKFAQLNVFTALSRKGGERHFKFVCLCWGYAGLREMLHPKKGAWGWVPDRRAIIDVGGFQPAGANKGVYGGHTPASRNGPVGCRPRLPRQPLQRRHIQPGPRMLC